MSAPEAIASPVPPGGWASRQRWTLWLGAPFGLPTGLHASFPIAFLLLTFTLSEEILPQLIRGAPTLSRLGLGAAATLALFCSVLAHEVGHGLAARRLGMRVDGVVLFALGGLIAIDNGPSRPRDEALVTAAGPLSNVAIAALASAVLALARESAPLEVKGLLLFLAFTNGLLAAFNLLPSLPLDGGRLLHALLWRALGSASAASRWAGGLGAAFGALVVAFGLARTIAGGPLEAVWYVVTGAFLCWGAVGELRHANDRHAKEPVAKIVELTPSTPPKLLVVDDEVERAA